MDDYLSARTQTAGRRPSGLRPVVAAIAVAFLLGAVAAWYLFGGSFSFGDLFSISRDDAAQSRPFTDPTGVASAAPLGGDIAALAGPGGFDQRLAEMEQRLARIDVQAQAAEGNAARAEALLIALATRRAVERGAPLGYLEEQLRMRFGDARSEAVRNVIAAGRNPVTLDRLVARLDGLGPQLAQAPVSEGTWTWLSREVGSLFVVRREDAPSPAPEQRIERARLFLESGRADAAASEISNMPNAAAAAEWTRDAERYAETQRALEQLELAALMTGQTSAPAAPSPAPNF